MEDWVRKCLNVNIIPIPTTIIPVTRLHPFKKFFIDIIILRNPFKLGNPFQSKRIRSILEYNDWIRKYCKVKELTFLDLEAVVRYSGTNRYLREDYAKLDGLHLNRKAYLAMDEILIPTLDRVKWEITIKDQKGVGNGF
jgi:lysophospholipase L1-like esterase